MASSNPARPTGITVLAVLAAIAGVFGLIASVALLGLGGAVAVTGAGYFGLAAVFGILGILLSIVQLALAYGFWTLQPWAWMLGVVVQVINIAYAIVLVLGGAPIFSEVIGVAINGLILYYLNQPHVRGDFGRA